MQNKITGTAVILLALGLLQAPRLGAQNAGPAMMKPAATRQKATPLDSLYRQAMAAVERQDWMRALIALERVQLVQPDYREAEKFVALSRANLLKQAKAADSGIAISGSHVLVVVVGVSLLGFLFSLPTNRARLHRLFGNYAGAALIYERLVVHKPSRMKLYPPLAEAYLRLDRRDATAMRIYKRVLELNLPTPLRAELHNVVTGYNLDEVQTRWHVNEVLDSRLKKKLAPRLDSYHQPKPSPAENSKTSRRPRKPAKEKVFFADYGYAGGLFLNGKSKIEK